MDGPGTYGQSQNCGPKGESGTAAKDTIPIGSGDGVSGADRMGMEVHAIFFKVNRDPVTMTWVVVLVRSQRRGS